MEALKDVIIVVHLMAIVALVGVVLIQRSEGGALGIGGSNNFLTGRGSGNVLTRTTGILAAVFFATSLGVTILTRMTAPPSAILDSVPAVTAPAPETTVPATGDATAPAATTPTVPTETTTGTGTSGGGILDELNAFTGQSGEAGTATPAPADSTNPAEPQVPTSQ
jgi:preprotein translocase subunit SecG